jgi:putative transposase
MTHDHSALLTQLDALVGADAGSMFAELIRAGLQALIDAEATQALGAGRYERTAERADYCNGTLSKTVATTSGDVEVQIPKLRSGWFFPSLIERRRRIDQALYAVIMEAYVHGPQRRRSGGSARGGVGDFQVAGATDLRRPGCRDCPLPGADVDAHELSVHFP